MTLTKILRLQLLSQLEHKLIEVEALIEASKESPLSLKERRRIFYQNYAASLSQTDWDEMEDEERKKIISMSKGRSSINFQPVHKEVL